ncbi:MAG: phosphatase PAP2 family protein [Bacteroidales bacterium]|nr:phosphatase PAP2 family protein [Bacteroidales bacterium]
MDMDIRQLRFNAAPAFRYRYDDYIQYSPAVLMAGLKAFGYKGRSSWGRMLVSDAFSAAVMAGAVNGLKYSVRRLRPDNTSRNSFPSGHTATAFMAATMLHKEYGWRSPWFSIGGYTVATVTGISRMLNNRHWMSDVLAGGAIGIGSVHLGYFLSDLIFKEKYLYDGYEKPDMFAYDFDHRYYEAGVSFARRFVLGSSSNKAAGILPQRGSSAAIFVNVPVVPRTGIAARVSANELLFIAVDGSNMEGTDLQANSAENSYNMYNALVGAFWQYPFPKLLEFEIKTMIGYAWQQKSHIEGATNGIDVLAEIAATLRAGENFRIKAFAEYETFSFSQQKPYINSFLLGFSTSFCW